MSTNIIPELNWLLELVKKEYGRDISTTTDFESLSVIIEKKTGELLSSSTLKRLYGYVSLRPIPRKSTLDILARYVGWKSYDNFLEDLRMNPQFNSSYFSTKIIHSSDLNIGQRLKIGWAPDRIVIIEYMGDKAFQVIESCNSQLMPGDCFEMISFMKNYPLFISSGIERDGEHTSPYVGGLQGGVNLLEILK